jgi:diguanylate cyclase (GGDEF)-like protein
MSINFYQGRSAYMLRDIFRQEGFNEIVSFLNVCLGFILFIYGAVTCKRTHIGKSIFYLGIFTMLLGIWSLTENGITGILFEGRAACSFIGFVSLIMLGGPFILFIHSYLQAEDKYLHKILLGLNTATTVLVFLLQIFGIADMKQTLSLTHIIMVLSLLYLPVTLIHIVRSHLINRRFWVTIWSLLSLCIPFGCGLYTYYNGSHNVDSYANVFFFLFIIIFAADVSLSAVKEIDAGKKAAIYQELAEKDLLTGCYNRNAYRNDTINWENLQDVLLLTCDLNNLKQCNDTLGHAYGDQYITDASTILKKVFSSYGKVYRIGGDEFCIIIRDRHKCNIEKLLASLIEEERVYNTSSPLIHLQIASGYAVFDPETDATIEDVRNRADELMYQNKKELKSLKIV